LILIKSNPKTIEKSKNRKKKINMKEDEDGRKNLCVLFAWTGKKPTTWNSRKLTKGSEPTTVTFPEVAQLSEEESLTVRVAGGRSVENIFETLFS
jgi:hypothetical protein